MTYDLGYDFTRCIIILEESEICEALLAHSHTYEDYLNVSNAANTIIAQGITEYCSRHALCWYIKGALGTTVSTSKIRDILFNMHYHPTYVRATTRRIEESLAIAKAKYEASGGEGRYKKELE